MRTALLTLILAATAFAGSRVTVVPIEDEIGPSTVYLVKRSLEHARDAGSSLVLFEINTPGGRVDSALDIANLIDKAGVPTVAFIRAGNFGGAQSAGALISIACGKIVMEPSATIGSAHPVDQNGVLASEKVISWVAATFRAWAEKKGLPPMLAMGMVDPDLELREVMVDGKMQLVDGDTFARLEREGKKLQIVSEVKPKGKLVNLTASEALKYGLSSATVETREAAFAHVGVQPSEVETVSRSWSETFVGFITQGMVTGLLVSFGFLFVWVEMKTPGVGIPAILAVTCFGLVFFGHYLVGLAEATEILLFVIGAALLIIEVFTPGFGVCGISGIVLILASLVLALQSFVFPSNPYQWNTLTGNFLTITASTGLAVVGFAALLRFLPQTPMFNRLVLQAEVAPAEGPAATVLVGRAGVATTDLRPSGKADVDGMAVDVLAEGDLIRKGEPITIVRIDGASVVVRRA